MNSAYADLGKQLPLDIQAPSAPTLDNFLIGRNAELLQLLRAVLARKEKERFVYIWGDAGCGKSHLLQAMVAAFKTNNQVAVFFLLVSIMNL